MSGGHELSLDLTGSLNLAFTFNRHFIVTCVSIKVDLVIEVFDSVLLLFVVSLEDDRPFSGDECLEGFLFTVGVAEVSGIARLVFTETSYQSRVEVAILYTFAVAEFSGYARGFVLALVLYVLKLEGRTDGSHNRLAIQV